MDESKQNFTNFQIQFANETISNSRLFPET